MKRIFLLISVLFSTSAWSSDILIIGDSHSCGAFGSELVKNFSKLSEKVYLYCAVSSAPVHWLKAQNPAGQKCQTLSKNNLELSLCNHTGQMISVADLLNLYPNFHVVIALGTNSLLSPTADATYKQLASEIKNDRRNCIWIGPPHLNPSQSKGYPAGRLATLEKNLDTFYPSLKNSVSTSCTLIDSREFTGEGSRGYSTVDGVHRTDSSGVYWSDQVFQKMSLPNSAN